MVLKGHTCLFRWVLSSPEKNLVGVGDGGNSERSLIPGRKFVGCGKYCNHQLLSNSVGVGVGYVCTWLRGLVPLQVLQSVFLSGERVAGVDGEGVGGGRTDAHMGRSYHAGGRN